MSQLTQRNIDILKIIVEEYLATGDVLGSKKMLQKYDLGVSSATVRNDMAKLETLELIYQPYNSAGRLPTAKGLRAFVDYLMEVVPDYFLPSENLQIQQEDIKKFANYVHKIVFELSKSTEEIAFFIVPERGIREYSGISSFLKKNFSQLGDNAYLLVEMLEDKFNFAKFISSFPIEKNVAVFIGEENILPYLKDYSIILKKVTVQGSVGYVGVIASLKMDYRFNISAVRGII